MEMDTVTETKEPREEKKEKEEKEEKGVSSKAEDPDTAEYSLLHRPTEDVYSETYFGNSAPQREGQRKQRVLQAGCAILSCVSLILLLVLIIVILSKEKSSSCSEADYSSGSMQTCARCWHCPDDWLELDRSCYHLSQTRLSWDQSQKNCSAQGGSLAVISRAKVQNYLVDKGNRDFWIGLRNRNGAWTWANNKSLTLNFWSGSGSGDCAVMKADRDGNWMKARCELQAYFICELQR